MNGIQQKLKYIGDYGCYFLSILKATGNLDYRHVIDYYDEWLKEGFIDKECTILKPAEIAYSLTHKKCRVEWGKSLDRNCSFAIAKWFNVRTGHSHFVLMSKDNIVTFDPLGDSVTVREGRIDSYRLFYLES